MAQQTTFSKTRTATRLGTLSPLSLRWSLNKIDISLFIITEQLCCQMCDVPSLVGKPKLFFIEACRGREHNMGLDVMMTKSSAPTMRSMGISLPNKQDVFVGFATVPGFVSFTSSLGSPYLQVCKTKMCKERMARRWRVCCRPTTRTRTCRTSTFWSNAGLLRST